jgi:hypothetical protein
MLLTLSTMDFIAAVFLTLHGIMHRLEFTPKHFEYNATLSIGNFVVISSSTWTCCIAIHLLYVIKHSVLPNSGVEIKKERHYRAATFAVQVFFYLPLQLVFWYSPDHNCNAYRGNNSTISRGNGIAGPCAAHHALLAAMFSTQCLIVVVVGIWVWRQPERITVGGASSSVERTYKRQILWFLVFYFIPAVQTSIQEAYEAADVVPQPYVRFIGGFWYFWQGLFNCLVL